MARSAELQWIMDTLACAGGFRAGAPALPVSVDPHRLVELALSHGVAALLGGRLEQLGELPAEVRTELLIAYNRGAREGALRLARLRDIMGLLRGLEFVVLKGPALLATLYHEAAPRRMIDVDVLLVQPAEREEARRRLEQEGFFRGRDLAGHHHLPMLRDPRGQLSVEIHSNLITPPLPEELMRDLFARRRPASFGDLRFDVLDAPDLLLHQALHALNDPIDTPLLRNFWEVACLARQAEEEAWRRLCATVEAYGLADRVGRALALAARWFGSPTRWPAPPSGFPERWAEWRLEWLEARGFLEAQLRQVIREHCDGLCFPVSQRNPWLLVPAAWRTVRRPLAERWRRWTSPAARAEGHILDLGDTMIFGDAQSGEVHLLNPLATRLWRAAAAGWSGRDLCRTAAPPESSAAARDALRLLRKLGILT